MEESLAAIAMAAGELAEPARLAMLLVGVFIGLIIGIMPGLGGLVGLTLILPFTFHMDPLMALSLMLGLHAVIATSDSIPAILFGVPGTVGSAATVMDGYPLAKQGEAGRALSAAFLSSLLGGIFGALALAVSIPFIRPLMLAVASPEMFALTIFGLSLVVVLSGKRIVPGAIAVCLGLLLSLVGEDYQSGTMRWTFDTLYLWSGIPLVPFALGLFAIPEIADIAIRRKQVGKDTLRIDGGWKMGAADVLRHWRVLLRSSTIGAILGALPGIGSSIIDWVAYGSTVRTAKDASRFGAGDIRGVIASEASNNAKEGGALVPTLAFGIPGSAAMTIMLGALSMHGVVPGPEMLTSNLHFTFALVLSLVLANIVGAGLCFLMAPSMARLALIPAAYIAPLAIAVSVLGALQGAREWGDLAVFLAAGMVGLAMRLIGWPRPPLLLGFVLGLLIERYLATSMAIYGVAFLQRPGVIVLGIVTIWSLALPLVRAIRNARRVPDNARISPRHGTTTNVDLAFGAVLTTVFCVAIYSAVGWHAAARQFPIVIAGAGLVFCAFLFLSRSGWISVQSPDTGMAADLGMGGHGLDAATFSSRLLSYCLWVSLLVLSALVLGPVLAVTVWTAAYMITVFRTRIRESLATALMLWLLTHLLFDRVLNIVWPQSMMSYWFSALSLSS